MRDTRSHPRFMLTPASIAWIDGVSLDAFTLWCALELYQARVGGTALVPRAKLHVATARRMTPKRIAAAVDELIDEGQLIDHGDAVELAVWEQPPVETWQDDVLRFRFLRNKRMWKLPELIEFVKQRDRSLCRYCGVRVIWGDQRSRHGATYDHVDPDLDNTRDNVVVACRACNGRKRDRTPEQAGMPLLRPGTSAAAAVASAATGTVPGTPRGGDASSAEVRSDPDPIQNRSRSGGESARARTRDRPEPNPIQIATHRTEGPRQARPGDGSVPRLRQTGGAIRLHPDDPAHPDNQGHADEGSR